MQKPLLPNSPIYRTIHLVEYTHQNKGVFRMYSMRNVNGHIQVYDYKGAFLFSADSEREAREEMETYAEFAC